MIIADSINHQRHLTVGVTVFLVCVMYIYY